MNSVSDGVETRWIAVVGFALLLVLTVILFLTPEANAYEISIYGAYPWYFWAIAAAGLVIGNVVIIRSAAEGTSDWRYGLLLVLAVVALLVFLPSFRGYASFGRADVLSHIGFIRDIQNTGSIGDQNIYPNFHLLTLTLSHATGVDLPQIIMLMAGIGSLFSILSFTALAFTVFDRQRALLSLPFVMVLLTVQSVPYVFSTFLVPFVLYIFVLERRKHAYHLRVALVLCVLSLVIYHPITSLFVLLIFGVYEVARLLNRRELLGTDVGGGADPVGTVPLSQLLVSVFMLWYLTFDKIASRFVTVLRNVTSIGETGSPVATYSSTVSQYTPALVDLLRILFVRYGQAVIVLTIGCLSTVVFGVAASRRRLSSDVIRTMFVGAFVLFTGFSVLFFLADLLVGFERPLLYAQFFGALLAGVFLSKIVRRVGFRPSLNTAVYLIVAALVISSISGLYMSPLSISENQQVTEMELDGSKWYFESRSDEVDLAEFGIDTYRFRDALYGRYSFEDDQMITSNTDPVPAHFNYTEYDSLGASYDEDTYMILPTVGRIYYENLYPGYREFWNFNSSDFQRLNRDRSVSRVYTNGDYTVHRVDATG